MNINSSLSVFRGVTRNPVTVTVAYRVVPGREAEFHSWGWGVLRATAQEPGFLGGGVLVDGEAEWHVVYRFTSEGSALAWDNSVARAEWQARGETLARETGRRTVQGSKAWFESLTENPSATAAAPRPPPKWKLWFVNMSAVFPPVLIFNLLVLPYLGDFNPLIRTLFLCLAVTAIVTWILMPRLQRFFKKWLYPPLQAIRGRHKRRAAQG
ncbi:antibiotic biosynthesis monooxygenase [Streptomyces phaeochromogenes]|uniref:antibiotic biosynthesis monooxygenase n=1 Tax=Streptomyces phaeochromogenes TaxID=1923 RepID=UPI002256C21B|nr:antibiotic biosynthesis monooxygenase [Streptomyces phaeochromogenes]MCX5599650.1 antibiotic biosynthesis monooxygenase [Streptomyces phaeochromogenes]